MKNVTLKIKLKNGEIKELSDCSIVVNSTDIPFLDIEQMSLEIKLNKPRIKLLDGLVYTATDYATIEVEECDEFGNPLKIPVKEIGEIIHRRNIASLF